MKRLEGVVVVTGGASGIGKATAIRCASEGAKVAVCDVQDGLGGEVVKDLRGKNLVAKYYHMDVSKEKDVKEVFKRIVSDLGLIQGLVNNAGIIDPANDTRLVHEGKPEVWEKILRVNLMGVLLCTKYALPYMIESGKGSIVNLSSVAACVALPGVGYTASKGALLSVTRLFAVDYAKYNIRVNSISPGFVNTPLLQSIWKETPEHAEKLRQSVPLNRLATADEIASVIAFLLSDDASHITGINIVVDGGFTAQ
ncbi:MAG: SDR family oxidoreductase [Candidatus Bathyarchaeia archaeon]